MVPEELIAKVLSGNCTEAEKRQVEEWVAQSEAHKQQFDQLKSIWDKADISIDINVDDALNAVHQRIGSPKKRSLKPFIITFTAAASIALVAMLTVFNPQETPVVSVTASTHGEQVDLPDGSQVWLNKDATIAYSETFDGDERPVKLQGEAYFDVAKNPEKPFVVSVGDASVKVLGTAFNIKQKKSAITVSVTEGKVAFSDEKNTAVLNKGDEAALTESDIVVSQFSSNNFLAWKTKKLEYKNEQVGMIVKDINELFDKTFVVKAESLDTMRISTSVDVNTFAEATELLALTIGAEIDSTGNEYVLIQP